MPEKSIEQVENEYLEKIAQCNLVITGLENNDSFKQVLKDFDAQRRMIDDNWQYISDPAKLEEMRITKLAVLSLLNIIDNYKHDLQKAQEELVKVRNPDTIINKDWD